MTNEMGFILTASHTQFTVSESYFFCYPQTWKEPEKSLLENTISAASLINLQKCILKYRGGAWHREIGPFQKKKEKDPKVLICSLLNILTCQNCRQLMFLVPFSKAGDSISCGPGTVGWLWKYQLPQKQMLSTAPLPVQVSLLFPHIQPGACGHKMPWSLWKRRCLGGWLRILEHPPIIVGWGCTLSPYAPQASEAPRIGKKQFIVKRAIFALAPWTCFRLLWKAKSNGTPTVLEI